MSSNVSKVIDDWWNLAGLKFKDQDHEFKGMQMSTKSTTYGKANK